MNLRQRRLEAESRARERREREDSAPRLRDEVATLSSLSVEVAEHVDGTKSATTRYVRHVVVERAPALFDIPCSEANCEDGGHDVTRNVMRALLDGETEFSGEDTCFGYRGGDRCERVMRYAGHAIYSDSPGPTKGGNGKG